MIKKIENKKSFDEWENDLIKELSWLEILSWVHSGQGVGDFIMI